MAGIGREVGGGGGHWRRGHPQFCVCELEETASLVVLEVSVPPYRLDGDVDEGLGVRGSLLPGLFGIGPPVITLVRYWPARHNACSVLARQ